MLRTIGLILLCSAACLNNPVYSTVTHSFQKGVAIEYDFPPHDPQIFINYMFWPVEANCKITSATESVDLFAEALVKKGKVNNVTLFAGQNLQLTIRSGEYIKLSADSGAKVQITNLGETLVHATCVSQ